MGTLGFSLGLRSFISMFYVSLVYFPQCHAKGGTSGEVIVCQA